MSNITNKKIIEDWFSVKRAAHLSEMTTAMVNYLCRYDLVTPSIGSKRGRGTSRKYSYSDLVLLRVISKLLANGISVLKLKKSLKALRARGANTRSLLKERYVVTNGFDIYFQNESVIEMLDSGQMVFAFVLELQKIRDEVDISILKELSA